MRVVALAEDESEALPAGGTLRYMGPELERMAELVRSGAVRAAVERKVGALQA